VTARIYDPLVVCALQIGWCPKCKAYTLRPEGIETNERFEQWEKRAEEANDVFLEMLTERGEGLVTRLAQRAAADP
jgi:hypothetical protein